MNPLTCALQISAVCFTLLAKQYALYTHYIFMNRTICITDFMNHPIFALRSVCTVPFLHYKFYEPPHIKNTNKCCTFTLPARQSAPYTPLQILWTAPYTHYNFYEPPNIHIINFKNRPIYTSQILWTTSDIYHITCPQTNLHMWVCARAYVSVCV